MYRKGVSALILNNQNELLLVNLVSFEQQYYSIPGGGIEAGETQEDAVIREIKEELGIDKNFLQIIGKSNNPVRFEFKSGPRMMHGVEYIGQERNFFLINFLGLDSDIKLDNTEVRKYAWVSTNDLDKYLLFEGQLASTKKILAELLNLED